MFRLRKTWKKKISLLEKEGHGEVNLLGQSSNPVIVTFRKFNKKELEIDNLANFSEIFSLEIQLALTFLMS